MKQNNLISIVALVGVVVLFVLHFTSNSSSTTEPPVGALASDSTETSTTTEDASSNAIVAYVNTDTVLAYYERAIEYRDELNAEKIKLQSEIGREEKSLLGEAQLYQQRAQTMSQFERYQKERELAQKEQDLMSKQERYSRRFSNMEADLVISLNEVVADFIERYCEDKSYRMVVGHQELGGALLWGSADLDITNEVLEGLNAEYSAEQNNNGAE